MNQGWKKKQLIAALPRLPWIPSLKSWIKQNWNFGRTSTSGSMRDRGSFWKTKNKRPQKKVFHCTNFRVQNLKALVSAPTSHKTKPCQSFNIWVCLKIVYPEKPNGFADHYPVSKWLFHWGYTPFSDGAPVPWSTSVASTLGGAARPSSEGGKKAQSFLPSKSKFLEQGPGEAVKTGSVIEH